MSPGLLIGAVMLSVGTVVDQRRRNVPVGQVAPVLGGWAGVGVSAFLNWQQVDQDLFWTIAPFLFAGSALGLLASPMVQRSGLSSELSRRTPAPGAARIDVQGMIDELRPVGREMLIQAVHALPGPYLVYWGMARSQWVAVAFGAAATVAGLVGVGLLMRWRSLAAGHEARLLS